MNSEIPATIIRLRGRSGIQRPDRSGRRLALDRDTMNGAGKDE